MPQNIETHDSTKPELTTTEARQSVSGTGTIYVLVIGVALLAVAFAAVYFW